MSAVETLSTHRCFGGYQSFHRHPSASTGTPMRYGVYSPPQAEHGPVPVIFYLAGLTCTEENFAVKAGAQRAAAEVGVMLVTPDTSPRGDGVPGDPDNPYDFGLGAGFYVDATQEPWSQHYRMWSYVTDELRSLLAEQYTRADFDRLGVMGHSMGGHGALTVALRNPRFRTCSAFAPIVAPSQVPWGRKALGRYLGPDIATWRRHDGVALIEDGSRVAELLVDQGDADPFLVEQLRPELLENACANAGITLTLRRHDGYDHGYYFIQTFIADHLRWHAERLARPA